MKDKFINSILPFFYPFKEKVWQLGKAFLWSWVGVYMVQYLCRTTAKKNRSQGEFLFYYTVVYILFDLFNRVLDLSSQVYKLTLPWMNHS